jgi:hypothetical protein
VGQIDNCTDERQGRPRAVGNAIDEGPIDFHAADGKLL